MHIVIDEIDGIFYADVILSPSELKRVKRNEMVDGQALVKKRRYYVGVRLQGTYDDDEEESDFSP